MKNRTKGCVLLNQDGGDSVFIENKKFKKIIIRGKKCVVEVPKQWKLQSDISSQTFASFMIIILCIIITGGIGVNIILEKFF